MRYPYIYWLQFNWPAAYSLCVLKLRYNQSCPFLVQSQISDFQEPAYFSVKSIALNNVNVRGGNVIKQFAREIGNSQVCIVIADKGEMSQKTMDM